MRPSLVFLPLPGALVLVACLLLLLLSSAAAQEPGGQGTWSIRPADENGPDGRANFSWELEPGASLADHVYVRNLGRDSLVLRVYASDAVSTPDGGFDVLPADTPPTDIGAWIQLDRQDVELGPGESAVIPFTLSVPDTATPGDHPGGIVAALSRAVDGADGDIRVDYRVGVRAYLRVSGELMPQLVVEDLRFDYAGTLNPVGGGDGTVTYTLTNPGNVRLSATQIVRITGPFGLTLAESDPIEVGQILPGQSVNASATLGVPPGLRLRAEVLLEPRLPGGAEGADLAAITARASAWAIPWIQLLLLAAALAGTAYLVRRRRVLRRPLPAVAAAASVEASAEDVRRFNEEYKDEILRISHGMGGQPAATGALITRADRDGLDIVASVAGEAIAVRVPWGQPVNTPLEMEGQLLRLSRERPGTPELEDVRT